MQHCYYLGILYLYSELQLPCVVGLSPEERIETAVIKDKYRLSPLKKKNTIELSAS